MAWHVPAGRGRVQQTHAWRVCRVDRLGSQLAVTDYHGLEHEIALSDVAVPTAPVREEIERELEARAGRRAFDEAFSAAGEVRRPEGWIPAVGERVVVQFVPTSWYLAEVLARDDERVRVRFVGGTSDDRYVPASHVAPHPAGQPAGAPPPVDAWVLVPSARETERWQPARVVRSGAELEVALRGGDQRKLPARQVIVVE